MGFDWSIVLGAVGGAGIGLAGDWSGRLSARRQAEQSRRFAREDAAEAIVAAREEKRREEFDAREYDTLKDLLASLNRLSSTKVDETYDMSSFEVVQRKQELVGILYYESARVRDDRLRGRLLLASDALDALIHGKLADYELYEVAYIVRQTLRESIGTRLRGESELPAVSSDWERLREAVLKANEVWRAETRTDRFNADRDDRYLTE